ncbi:hypothetical protein [Paractinoplanes maris]|uniref:hypothetical protein n=1 Tax=Paractinoplanes maris TaxID=1734446 RepID=UPI00201FED72|nr:hypothetical protein [Actinoplanes maris]
MNDDDYVTALLRPLAGEPSGPPRIDVVKAMRDGRRRRRRWWATGSLAAVAVTAVTGGVLVAARPPAPRPLPDLPPDPVVPASCTAAPLPAKSYRSAEVTAGDSSGRWLIGRAEPDVGTPSISKSHLVWHDGKLVADVVPPVGGMTMTDINASGVAVGISDSRADHPWTYRDGTFTRLKGGTGFAVAINDSGVVAGQLGRDQKEKPVRWSSPAAAPEPLAAPDGVRAEVRDIAPDGTIAGVIGDFQGYLWLPDGTARPIPAPHVDGKPALGFEPLVFRYGWLYGTVAFPVTGGPGSEQIDYRYEPRTGTWQEVGALAMKTQVAGPGRWRFGQDNPEIYVGPRTLSLPAYLPAVDAYLGSFVVEGISDDAHVVSGIAMSGPADLTLPIQPLIWRCR